MNGSFSHSFGSSHRLPNRSSCFLLQNRLTRCWSGAVSLWQVILMRPRGKGVGVSDGFPVLLSAPVCSPRHGCCLCRGLISGSGALACWEHQSSARTNPLTFFYLSWELGHEANIQPPSGRELGSWTWTNPTSSDWTLVLLFLIFVSDFGKWSSNSTH